MLNKRPLILLFAFAVFMLMLFCNTSVKSYKISPPAFYCNDPNPFTNTINCTYCHSGTPAFNDSTNFILQMGTDGTALSQVITGVTTYIPGTLYFMRVTGTRPSPVYGFELTADDTTNTGTNVTNFAIINSVTTSLLAVSYNFVAHHNASSNNQWTFTWTAPSNYKGPISFYYAGNDGVNGDTQYGDSVYVASKTITVNPTSGINDIESKLTNFSVFPTVFNGNVQIAFNLKDNATVNASVINMNGQVVKTILNQQLSAGAFNRMFDLSNLAAGVYLLKLQVADAFTVSKIVKE